MKGTMLSTAVARFSRTRAVIFTIAPALSIAHFVLRAGQTSRRKFCLIVETPLYGRGHKLVGRTSQPRALAEDDLALGHHVEKKNAVFARADVSVHHNRPQKRDIRANVHIAAHFHAGPDH